MASGGAAVAEDIIDRVRRTCAATVESSPHVRIDDAAIAAFVDTLAAQKPTDLKPGPLELPLRFDSPAEEANVYMLLMLLNFASGFRHELHEAVGTGAFETIMRGILCMHLSGHSPTADYLVGWTADTVAELFGISRTIEVPVMPAVYETKPGPLAPLVDMLVQAGNETGQALRNRGHESFTDLFEAEAAKRAAAAAVAAATASSAAAGAATGAAAPTASAFVQLLVDVFPPFRDVTVVRGQEVWLLKKAQLAAAHMHAKFAARLPHLFNFASDVDRLTVMADNVLPAVLRAHGVLVIAPAIATRIDSRAVLPPGEVETDLRAAAVTAGERIVAAARAYAEKQLAAAADGAATDAAAGAATATGGDVAAAPAAAAAAAPPSAEVLAALRGMNAAQLDEFLWNVGKRPDLRKVERHATPTYYY